MQRESFMLLCHTLPITDVAFSRYKILKVTVLPVVRYSTTKQRQHFFLAGIFRVSSVDLPRSGHLTVRVRIRVGLAIRNVFNKMRHKSSFYCTSILYLWSLTTSHISLKSLAHVNAMEANSEIWCYVNISLFLTLSDPIWWQWTQQSHNKHWQL